MIDLKQNGANALAKVVVRIEWDKNMWKHHENCQVLQNVGYYQAWSVTWSCHYVIYRIGEKTYRILLSYLIS